jgi:hypothetical protein
VLDECTTKPICQFPRLSGSHPLVTFYRLWNLSTAYRKDTVKTFGLDVKNYFLILFHIRCTLFNREYLQDLPT